MPDLSSAFHELGNEPIKLIALKVALALAIAFLGWRFGKTLVNAERRLLLRAHVDAILAQFLRNASYALFAALIFVTCLELAGFPITSLLTVLGAMALAIGLALNDSLSHIAAGLILIALRPFRIGDRVLLAAQEGVVEGVFVFQTQLRTADNRTVILMNGSVIAAPIVNYSRLDAQRLTLSLDLANKDDLARAVEIARTTLSADARVAAKPPPEISIGDIDARTVGLSIRAWVRDSSPAAVHAELLQTLQHAYRQNRIDVAAPPSS